MINQHDRTAKLSLDDTNSFADNCEVFLSNIQPNDPEMASILRENWNALMTVVREGERDLKARSEFNTYIAAALDLLIAQELQKDGE